VSSLGVRSLFSPLPVEPELAAGALAPVVFPELAELVPFVLLEELFDGAVSLAASFFLISTTCYFGASGA